MNSQDKNEIDEFISDWNWSNESYKFARDLGKYLIDFIAYLRNQDLGERAIKKHYSNAMLIGHLECDYGDHKKFKPGILLNGPHHSCEFERKVGGSDYMVKSYKSTWRKLHQFVCKRENMGVEYLY